MWVTKMFITHLKLKNWRNFRDVDVDFQDITYLMGPNASGKSNFLDVFRFLRDIANPQGGGLQQALNSRGGMSKVRCLAARNNPKILIDIKISDTLDILPKWEYILEIAQETTGRHLPYVSSERVINLKSKQTVLERPDERDHTDSRLLSQTALEQIAQNGEFRDIADFFENILYLHLVPQLLKFGNELAVKRMTNDPFGQGFLETIASTPEKVRSSRLRRIESILKEVIHGMSNLIFERDLVGRPHLKMKYTHWRPNGGWQLEEEFSDGTLRMIAFLWTLLDTKSVILLEEPELSLHQDIIEKIPELILRAKKSRKKADGQIFISTHSSAILSSPVIRGQYLILKPSDKGEGTTVTPPSKQEESALDEGISPADILLPKTNQCINVQRHF